MRTYEALEGLLLFEEMQELNLFLENPERMITFASLQKEHEALELLHELTQENDTNTSKFDTSSGGIADRGI